MRPSQLNLYKCQGGRLDFDYVTRINKVSSPWFTNM